MPFEVGRRYVPQKKPYYPLFEKSFEIGEIVAMEGSYQALVEVILF